MSRPSCKNCSKPSNKGLFRFLPGISIVYEVIATASKIGLPQNRLRVYEQKSPIGVVSEPKKYILWHSNISLSFVLSSNMICLTNENTVLLWCTIYFCALEPLHGSRFFKLQLLLDELCWYIHCASFFNFIINYRDSQM